MRNSKRLLATLLTLCIMASFVFTGTAFAADEAEETLTFPAEIAEKCGYTDYVYFSRRFKQITGISPREYTVV